MSRGPRLGALLAVVLVASGCAPTTTPATGAPGEASPPGSAPISDDCLATDGYPCSPEEVDPAVLEREDRYMTDLARIRDEGTREEAFAWIQEQEGVVEAELDETTLAFRLEGGMPIMLLEPLRSNGAPVDGAAAAVDVHALAAGHRPPPATASPGARTQSVVGEGTARDNPQNRKKALLLTPYEWQGLSMFLVPGPDPKGILKGVPDYAHEPDDVRHVTDDDVTPFSLLGWDEMDLVFLETHGGQWYGNTWLATGVKTPYVPAEDSFNALCRRIMDTYQEAGLKGLACGELHDKPSGLRWVNLGVLPRFWRDAYGDAGGLQKTIVYIGACLSLANPDVAGILAGASSAYLGWTGTVFFNQESNVAASLVYLLARSVNGGQKTVEMARRTLCDVLTCRGTKYSPSGRTELALAAGAEGRRLRAYSLATARDPRAPTSIGPGLQDGAELRITGQPGDGVEDRLSLAIEITGVIDPDDPTGPVSFAQASDAASMYNFRVLLDDEEIGRDNLGRKANPDAVLTQLNDTTWRYVFTADLPFDVDPAGTNTTLTVVVDLPGEDATSEYEVRVRLVGAEPGATITIGPRTWEFELFGIFGAACERRVPDVGGYLLTRGYVNGDTNSTSFTAHLEPEGRDVENLFSVHFVTVTDPASGLSWMADELEFPMLMALAAIPDGASQINEVTITDDGAFGTATFIELGAVYDAWDTGGPLPAPEPGTFEIRCGS